MIYLGIDPGMSGAIAYLGEIRGSMVWTTPGEMAAIVASLVEAEVSGLAQRRVLPGRPCFAAIEAVHAFPKQGLSSTFKFGENFGEWKGILYSHGIPFDTVTPAKWQRELGCLSRGNKKRLREKAEALFPDLDVNAKTADALLLAEYCRRKYAAEGNES